MVTNVTSNNQKDEIQFSGIINISVEDDFVIKFVRQGSGAQVTIDDIIWTAYEGQGGETGEYCIPEGTNSDRYINNFSTTGGLENISNMGTGFSTAGYGDFYDTHAVEQVQGESVDFSATIVGGYAHFKVWVDWNQDGEFDDTEEVVAYITTGSDIQNGSFEVPADAALGETRMRIASDWGYLLSIDPCATGWEYGEFEDYKFVVSEGDNSEEEDPCADKTVMECGVEYTALLVSNDGYWTNYTDVQWNYNGTEKVWEFTAPETGTYEFHLDEGEKDADFFLMDACSNEATNLLTEHGSSYWTGGGNIETMDLEEGVTYYLIADLFSSNAESTVTVKIVCPEEGGTEPEDPVYCEPELDCIDGDMITNVTFQEIDNDSACSPNGYGDYTHLVASVEAGETYPISVSVGDGWWSESISVWIDFDNSGTFDEDEFFYVGTGDDSAPHVADIAIPADIEEGNYRMRVRVTAIGEEDTTWDKACDEEDFYGETEDYTVQVGEAIDPEPEDGCLWTVVVESSFYGDEVEWEFRDSEGTILLSGGNYEEYEYYDEQSVNAEGPVEFFISAGGALWDNIPVYSVSNENGVLVSGILYEAGERTYSDLNCSDMPEPEPSYTCEDNMVSYSDDGVESAIDFSVSQLAIDLKAGDYSFPVYGIEVTFLADNPNTVTFSGILYNDEEGLPGTEISQPNLTMVNAEVIDSAYGFDVYVFRLAFDQPIEIEANSTNWLQINSNAEAWVNSWDVFGNGFVYRNQYTNNEWVKEYDDLVYTLICEELGVADLNSFDFAYYPNPVKDVLNITSQKGINSVSAFNLTGQKVMNNAKVNNGQIDVSKLAVGTYVFKVTLEDGSVETFKIIKR